MSSKTPSLPEGYFTTLTLINGNNDEQLGQGKAAPATGRKDHAHKHRYLAEPRLTEQDRFDNHLEISATPRFPLLMLRPGGGMPAETRQTAFETAG